MAKHKFTGYLSISKIYPFFNFSNKLSSIYKKNTNSLSKLKEKYDVPSTGLDIYCLTNQLKLSEEILNIENNLFELSYYIRDRKSMNLISLWLK